MEMKRGVSSVYPVIFIGVKLHLKLFISLYKCFCEIHGILAMDVVIATAMYQQEFALQSISKIDG